MNGPFSRLYFIQELVGSQFVPPSNLLSTGLFFSLADETDKLLFTVDYLVVIRRDLYHVN